MKTQILLALVVLGLAPMAQALEPVIKPMPAQQPLLDALRAWHDVLCLTSHH